MKWKKIIPTKSPVAWAMLAGITLISASPTARKKVRQWTIKGTSALIGLTNKIREQKPEPENLYQFDFLNSEAESHSSEIDADSKENIANQPMNQDEATQVQQQMDQGEELGASQLLEDEGNVVDQQSMQGEVPEANQPIKRKEGDDTNENNGIKNATNENQ